LLKGSGVILGGLAIGGAVAGVEAGKAMAQQSCAENCCGYPNGIQNDSSAGVLGHEEFGHGCTRLRQ
jgi:hypothetical protein